MNCGCRASFHNHSCFDRYQCFQCSACGAQGHHFSSFSSGLDVPCSCGWQCCRTASSKSSHVGFPHRHHFDRFCRHLGSEFIFFLRAGKQLTRTASCTGCLLSDKCTWNSVWVLSVDVLELSRCGGGTRDHSSFQIGPDRSQDTGCFRQKL